MIRAQMNGLDWLILGFLGVIWGGAFFFIGVAVRHVQPLTYVWLRLTIAAAGLWAYVYFRGETVDLPRRAWGSILLLAILASWGIALVEYVFQVPANRIGYGRFSVTQLKIAQECITLVVFLPRF